VKALVTGATGFVGIHLVPALLQRGDTVRILARTEARAAPLRSAGAEVIIGDLAQPATVAGIADGMEVVFHLVSAMRASDAVFERVDVQGTERLILEAERAGVRRFVYPGTLSAYPLAEERDGAVIDERRPLDSSGLLGNYARSKARAEEAVLAAQRRGRMEGVIVRLGWTCGEGAAVFPPHVCRVLTPKVMLLFGDGSVPLPLTFIDNAVDALILAATVPGIGGESFNIVDDDSLTQRQYIELYMQSTGALPRVLKLPRLAYYTLGALTEIAAAARNKEPTTTRHRVRARLRRVRWDCSKAHRVLRWQPRVPLRTGLAQVFRAYIASVAGPRGSLQ
jgi:nucleoside-diphosphate-sugar epimerase